MAKNSTAKRKTENEGSRLAKRDRVVLDHLPLVRAIAVRVHENLPVHVEVDDMIHAGILGLFDAADKYDPDKQVAFSSYAKHRIKGAILDLETLSVGRAKHIPCPAPLPGLPLLHTEFNPESFVAAANIQDAATKYQIGRLVRRYHRELPGSEKFR